MCYLIQNVIQHKIDRADNEAPEDILARDLIAINEFLHYVDAEPFITPEKAINTHRVAFKKVKRVRLGQL